MLINMVISKNDSDSLEQVVSALKAGRVVILPTDTVYGFSGIVPASDAAIRAIKGRAETKPFIQLIARPQDIALYTDDSIPPALLAFWPGPLTIIVNNKAVSAVSGEVAGEDASVVAGTTAFRCPGDPWVRNIISRVGAPIYSTSVNRSGAPLLTSVPDMKAEFGAEVALIVDAGPTPRMAVPSTIVSVADGAVQVLRQGAVHIYS